MQHSQDISLGHGRIERRELWALPIYDDFLDWPGARLMLRLERTVIHKNTGLLRVWRQHWHIENRLHYVRDVSMDEDSCRVRTANGPRTLAAVRNTILTVLRRQGLPNVAEALRTFAQQPYRALAQFILL